MVLSKERSKDFNYHNRRSQYNRARRESDRDRTFPRQEEEARDHHERDEPDREQQVIVLVGSLGGQSHKRVRAKRRRKK